MTDNRQDGEISSESWKRVGETGYTDFLREKRRHGCLGG